MPWLLLLSASLLSGCKVAKAYSDFQEHASASTRSEAETRVPLVTAQARDAARVHTERKPVSGCPPEMVRIIDYCVDRYEATLVEANGANGANVAHPACEPPHSGVRYEARSVAGALPQGYISRVQSEAACRNAGKRLCSAYEWYTACRGSQWLTFPYGKQFIKGKCNSGKPHLLGRLFGNDPRLWTYDHHFNNPRLNQEPGFLSPTGEYTECTNDYGAYDMVGNLHEWVSDSVDHSLEVKLSLVDGVRGAISRNLGNGVFMGGFYSTTAQQGEGCDFVTLGHEPNYHDYSTGFRCCKDALQSSAPSHARVIR